MSVGTRIVGAIAGSLGVVAAPACLDINPMWVDPIEGSGGSSGGATTGPMTTGPMTTVEPTTVEPTTVGATTETASGTTMGGSSGPPPACGDGAVDPGEECDDGPNNADSAACTASCKAAVCGDGLIQASVEECDLGFENADDGKCTLACKAAKCGDTLVQKDVEQCDDGNLDIQDGCLSDCTIPVSCKAIKVKNNAAPNGMYKIDPDGVGVAPLLPVECDMTTAGGGWTVIEKSPLAMPIGLALFIDMPMNMDNPLLSPHRLPKAIMIALQTDAAELRIDCRGPEYLLAADTSLFAGEKPFNMCADTAVVTYKEAKLGIGPMLANTQICTQLRGGAEGGCGGAFSINEKDQGGCGLPSYPWGGQPVLVLGAYAFAPDSPVKDMKHDCHKPGAVRYVMLR